MAKGKTTAFFCKECGYETSKWLGQCPGCKEWNTFVAELVTKKTKGLTGRNILESKPVAINEVDAADEERISTGFSELDRVLGGGIVPGGMVLVGGDPGIGKSTLLLQVCRNLSNDGKKVLYISGEESVKQIKLRANRIGKFNDKMLLLCETSLDTIEEQIKVCSRFGTRKCKSGKRIYKRSHAGRKGKYNSNVYSRSCNKRGGCGRTKSVRAYGRYSSLF